MPWLCESNLTWLQRFSIRLLQCGPIPKHVAFIMDGNRRYATKKNLKNRIDGHVKGLEKSTEVLQWCSDIGVTEMTMYAFSIENFKRSKEEMDELIQLMVVFLEALCDAIDKLNERGVCFRIIGNLSLIPLCLQRIIVKLMRMTKHNTRFFWNYAFAYTSRDEMTESIRTIIKGVESSELNADDINEDLFKRCMYFNESPDPDLIIRTSGESRLSDFLTYQSSTAIIYFGEILWPEIGIWNLLALIFYYQQHKQGMVNAGRCLDSYVDKATANKEQVQSFVEQVKRSRNEYMEDLVRSDQRCESEVTDLKNEI